MDQLKDIVDRVANHGGPPMTFSVPEDAIIHLDDRHDGSHLLAGATITTWPEDAARDSG